MPIHLLNREQLHLVRGACVAAYRIGNTGSMVRPVLYLGYCLMSGSALRIDIQELCQKENIREDKRLGVSLLFY